MIISALYSSHKLLRIKIKKAVETRIVIFLHVMFITVISRLIAIIYIMRKRKSKFENNNIFIILQLT